MPKTTRKRLLRRAKRYGPIALVGAASTGKTAYLIALDLSTDARQRLTEWHLRESPELHEYVANLGEFIAGTNRRRLQQTQRGKASRDLDLFSASHRSVLPPPLRHKYEVAIPDMAGEVYNLIAGLEKPVTEEDKKSAAAMLATLRRCRALICLIDVTPRIDKVPAAQLRARQKAEIARQMKGLDHVLRQLRRPGQTLVVTLALTKSDTIAADEREIELPIDECARHAHLLRHGLDPLESGMTALQGGRVRYALDARNDNRTEKDRGADVDDLAHHDAVARDWLRCHVPAAHAQFEATAALDDLSLDVFLISSWGKALDPIVDSHNVAFEPVPEPGEIRPVRLFAPIRSVLDRLHEGRVRRSFALRLVSVAAVLLSAVALGPGWVWWFNAQALVELARGDLLASQARLRLAAANPTLPVLPAGLRGDLARTHLELARAMARSDARTGDAATASAEHVAALACSKRGIEIAADPEAVAWRAGYLRSCVERMHEREPDAALGYLLASHGVVEAPLAASLAHQVMGSILDRIEVEVDGAFAARDPAVTAPTCDRALATLARLDAAVVALGQPRFCLDGTSIQATVADLRARVLGLRALTKTAAWPRDADLDGALKQSKEIVLLAAAAMRCLQTTPLLPANVDAWVRALAPRCMQEILQQPVFALVAADVSRDPTSLQRRLEAVLSLRDAEARACGCEPPIRAAVARFAAELVEDLWRALLAGGSAAAGSRPRDEAPTLHLLRTIHGSGIEVAEMEDLELGQRLDQLLTSIRADDYSGDVATARATLKRAAARATTVGQVRALLAAVRAALERAPQKPGTLEPWIAIATEVAEPDSRLAVLLADARLRLLFLEAESSLTGAPAAPLREAVLAVLADDQVGRHRMLGLTGDWLTRSASSLQAAFGLRRAIDVCLMDRPDLRTRAAAAVDLFRRTLFEPPEPLPHDTMQTAVLGVLELVTDPAERAADLSLLVALARTDRTAAAEAGDGPQAAPFSYLDSLLPEIIARLAVQVSPSTATLYQGVLETLADELRRNLEEAGPERLELWLRTYGALADASTRLRTLTDLARLAVACQRRQALAPTVAAVVAAPASETSVVEAVLIDLAPRLAGAAPETVLELWEQLAHCSPSLRAAIGSIRKVLGRRLVTPAAGETAGDAITVRYLQGLADGPGDQETLTELLAAAVDDKLPPLAAAHVDLVAGRVRESLAERVRERAFRVPIEAAAIDLQTSKRDGLTTIAARTERHRGLANDAGARRATAALDGIQHLTRWLTRNDLDFRLLDALGIYVTRDEVSLGAYRTFLGEDPGLRVSLRLAGEVLSLGPEGASEAFSRRFKSDDEPIFGVDPWLVHAYLKTRGARLPATSEWLSCYGAGPATGATPEQVLEARTGGDLEKLGDVSGPLRGMRYGVREWTLTPTGEPRALGASWMRPRGNPRESTATRVSEALDVGFRIAIDATPRAVTEYLEYISK